MSEATLREVNQIPPKMLVKAGSTLLVSRGATRQADVTQVVADSAMIALAPDLPPLRKVSFKAGKKDNVASVASRYRVSAEQVAQWNQVGPSASFKAGQTLVVYTPAKAVRVAAKPAPKLSTRGRPVASAGGPVRVAISVH
jgi:membrane-bound lytic murein transglycosylase D